MSDSERRVIEPDAGQQETWIVYSTYKGGSEITRGRYATEKTARHWVGFYNKRDVNTRTQWNCAREKRADGGQN